MTTEDWLRMLGVVTWGWVGWQVFRGWVVSGRQHRELRKEKARLEALLREREIERLALQEKLDHARLQADRLLAETALELSRFHRRGKRIPSTAERQQQLAKDWEDFGRQFRASETYRLKAAGGLAFSDTFAEHFPRVSAALERQQEQVELLKMGEAEPRYVDAGPPHLQDGFAEGELPLFLRTDLFADGGPVKAEGRDACVLPDAHSPWCSRADAADLDRWDMQDDWPSATEPCPHSSHESRSA